MWDWLFINVPWWTVVVGPFATWIIALLVGEWFATRRHKRIMAAYRARIAATYANTPEENQ